MMKKRFAAFFIAVFIALTFAACASADSDLGTYNGTYVSIAGLDMSFSELYDGENSIELKANGKALFTIEGSSMDCAYTVADGRLEITHDSISCIGTIEDGVITLNDFFGIEITMIFEKND